ncbi:MAG TPA: hypothetical protein VK190_02450 [Pseudoneobacillus sp.]|nr:hypothetical protein [Pseudoneobacillus sp.]
MDRIADFKGMRMIRNDETDVLEDFAKSHGYIKPVCGFGGIIGESFDYVIFDESNPVDDNVFMCPTIEEVKRNIIEWERGGTK